MSEHKKPFKKRIPYNPNYNNPNHPHYHNRHLTGEKGSTDSNNNGNTAEPPTDLDITVTIRYTGLKATQYFSKFTNQSFDMLKRDLLQLKIPHPKHENVVLTSHGRVEFAWFGVAPYQVLHKNLIQKLTPKDPEGQRNFKDLLESLSMSSATFRTVPAGSQTSQVTGKKRALPAASSNSDDQPPRKKLAMGTPSDVVQRSAPNPQVTPPTATAVDFGRAPSFLTQEPIAAFQTDAEGAPTATGRPTETAAAEAFLSETLMSLGRPSSPPVKKDPPPHAAKSEARPRPIPLALRVKPEPVDALMSGESSALTPNSATLPPGLGIGMGESVTFPPPASESSIFHQTTGSNALQEPASPGFAYSSNTVTFPPRRSRTPETKRGRSRERSPKLEGWARFARDHSLDSHHDPDFPDSKRRYSDTGTSDKHDGKYSGKHGKQPQTPNKYHTLLQEFFALRRENEAKEDDMVARIKALRPGFDPGLSDGKVKEIRALRHELDVERRDARALKRELEILEHEVAAKRTALDKATASLDAARQDAQHTASDLQNALSELRSMRSELQRVKNELTYTKVEYQKSLKAYDTLYLRAQASQGAVAVEQDRARELNAKVYDLEHRLARANARANAAEATTASDSRKPDPAFEELRASFESLRRHADDLQARLNAERREKQSLASLPSQLSAERSAATLFQVALESERREVARLKGEVEAEREAGRRLRAELEDERRRVVQMEVEMERNRGELAAVKQERREPFLTPGILEAFLKLHGVAQTLSASGSA